MTKEEVQDCFDRQIPVMYAGKSYPITAVITRRVERNTLFYRYGDVITQAELDVNGCTYIVAPRDLELRKY